MFLKITGSLGAAGDSATYHTETVNSSLCTLCFSSRSISRSWLPLDCQLGCLPVCLDRLPVLKRVIFLCKAVPCLVHKLAQFHS